MKRTIAAIIFACGALTAGAAMAGHCGYQNCWGAVGISDNGSFGWSSEYSTESGAITRVRNQCPGCNRIETFYNTCGAIATGSSGAWGFGWAGSRGQAEGNAVTFCANYGYGCQTVVWACSK